MEKDDITGQQGVKYTIDIALHSSNVVYLGGHSAMKEGVPEWWAEGE